MLAYATFTTAIKNYQMNVKKKCQETISLSNPPTIQWTGPTDPVVSLTFCELSKIMSKNIQNQKWHFGTCTKFQLEIFIEVKFVQHTNFERIFWKARKTLVKQPPGWRAADSSSGSPQQSVPLSLWSIHDSLQKKQNETCCRYRKKTDVDSNW